MEFSPRPSKSRISGKKRLTCRHSSDPIEPPAPVTKILSSWRYPAISARSTWTGFRPNRSSIRTSLAWLKEISPLAKVKIPGKIRTGNPVSCAWLTISLSRLFGAEGMATRISSTSYFRLTWANWSNLPATGTPCNRQDILRGSSSTTATGRWVAVCSRSISRITRAPVYPAPTTRIRLTDFCPDSHPVNNSRRIRIASRAPPIRIRTTPKSITKTLREMRRSIKLLIRYWRPDEITTAFTICKSSGRLE